MTFDSELANTLLGLNEADRKQLFKQGPITREAIKQLGKKSSKKSKGKNS